VTSNKIGKHNYPKHRRKHSLKENYTGVLTINQEQIKPFQQERWGRIEKLYFKTTVIMLKKSSYLSIIQ
jgi:hypothetical protein